METADYCDYELSLALKVAGFDYPCYFYYTRKDSPDDHVWLTTSEEAPIDYNRSVYAGCSMPTLAQAQKWLREVKGVIVFVEYTLDKPYDGYSFVVVAHGKAHIYCEEWDTYESALSAGIETALELIKNGE